MFQLSTIFILVSILLFVVGMVLGWYVSTRHVIEPKTHLRVLVGILVTVMWVISIVAEIIITGYTVGVLVHGIMGAVVGYLFSEDGITINIGQE